MGRPPVGDKPMSAVERNRLSRATRQQTGKRIDVMLGPEASEALEKLRSSGEYGDNTKDIVEKVLIKESKRAGRRKEEEL